MAKKFLKAYSPRADKKGQVLINVDHITHVLDTDKHDVTVWLSNGEEYCLLDVDSVEHFLEIVQKER